MSGIYGVIFEVNKMNVKHWGIIKETQTWIEGDERSRTNPGHGYPGGYERKIIYEAYDDEEKWKEAIGRLIQDRTKFQAIIANPVISELKVVTTS